MLLRWTNYTMNTEIIEKKVKFLVDRDGRKTHAVLPIEQYEELLEDMHDAEVVKERRKEGSVSISKMKKRLYGTEEVPGLSQTFPWKRFKEG